MRGSYCIHQFVNRIAPKALILLYHRVSVQASDPQLLCVTPDNFTEQMQILRQHYYPLSLKSLRKRQAFNFWPQRSVVITFDDGYADNFQTARKILEANDNPATVFVTSGMVESQKEYRWDELERIFLSTSTLPAKLEIIINHKEYSWGLESTTQDCTSLSWNVLKDAPFESRQQVYLDLMKLLHAMDVPTRESLLIELSAWAGVDRNQGRQDHLAVNADELCSLPKNGLLEIGAHTKNHLSLSAIPLAVQKDEIYSSKAALEKILDRPVDSFAYPFGERSDYSQDTVKLVREAGFTSACSNYPGFVNSLRDPYQLPRYIVRDCDGETFARQLDEWFNE